jgi:hypothetical protein
MQSEWLFPATLRARRPCGGTGENRDDVQAYACTL